MKIQHFGNHGHLCVGSMCQFHLCTQVGDYLISTVGEYLPDYPVREITAKHRGIVLEGQGDERLADYMRKIGFGEIGAGGRLYETMVFKAGEPCPCGCGIPAIVGRELDFEAYKSPREANAGHRAMCRKYMREGAEAS